MAVVLALGKNTKDALRKARSAASKIKVVEGRGGVTFIPV